MACGWNRTAAKILSLVTSTQICWVLTISTCSSAQSPSKYWHRGWNIVLCHIQTEGDMLLTSKGCTQEFLCHDQGIPWTSSTSDAWPLWETESTMGQGNTTCADRHRRNQQYLPISMCLLSSTPGENLDYFPALQPVASHWQEQIKPAFSRIWNLSVRHCLPSSV